MTSVAATRKFRKPQVHSPRFQMDLDMDIFKIQGFSRTFCDQTGGQQHQRVFHSFFFGAVPFAEPCRLRGKTRSKEIRWVSHGTTCLWMPLVVTTELGQKM